MNRELLASSTRLLRMCALWDVPTETRARLIAQADANDAALASPPAAVAVTDGWLPIESAPKDGTAILAWWRPLAKWRRDDDGSCYAVTQFRDDGWRPAGDDEDDEWGQPAYWQPLPAPPTSSAQSAGGLDG